ncbi:MAG: undecaprenyl-diphosphatase [Armatimonadetes bacterium]|nr:undecaprenyl-diphosphatase [Armatimonadota bacterium]
MLDLVILGIVQGLTEFLPVSSTAHLLFAEHYLGIQRPGLVLEGVLHLGTAAAAVALFWPDVVRLIRGTLRLIRGGARGESNVDPYLRLALVIAAATAVTAALGLAFADPLERMFASLRATASQLLVTGTLLLWHRQRGARAATEATVTEGLALGLAQAVAIVPGISRSGTTIVMGLALGLRRTEAARLSFLIAIPAITGAGLFSLKDAGLAGRAGFGPAALLVGFATAAIVGAAAILWLMDLVRRGRLIVFSVYCWVVGLLVLLTTR